MARTALSIQRIRELFDDPAFALAVAETPERYQDEIDAINEYLRGSAPALPAYLTAADAVATRIVGRRTKRIEDPGRLTGQAIYTSDVQLPGMLQTAILHSPHAHALIESIDTSAAEALPGVRAVLTFKNAPKTRIGGPPDRYVMNQEMHFAGEEVAAVAADDIHTAREAVRLIRVGYKVLPQVTDWEEALKPGAPDIVGQGKGNSASSSAPIKRGDFDAAYAAASIKLEGTYRTTTLQHATLEPRVSVVRWDGPDEFTIWVSTQYAPGVRNTLAGYFSLPRSRVRVICQHMGGGFGDKGGAGRDAYIAALLARITQRPVRLEYDRPGNFKAASHRYAATMRFKAGASADGKLLAYSVHNIGDAGAYQAGSTALVPTQRVYHVEHAHFRHEGAITNRGPSGPQRCVGDPQGTFCQEIFIDELAEKIGMNPLDFRLKNIETKIDQDRKLPWASCGLTDCIQKGADAIGWKQKWHKPQAAIKGTKAHGIGMAAHACAHGSMSAPMAAMVKIDRDGSLDVIEGATDIGAGQSTVMTMIAAETVGVKLEESHPSWGDTAAVPDAGVTAGSRSTISVGNAVRNAALDLKRQILEQAARPLPPNNQPLINGKPEDLDTGDGFVFLKANPSTRVPIKDVVTSTGSPMLGRGTHVVPAGYAMSVFAAGFAEVEVDVDTGEVTLLRYVATDDMGRAINPLAVEQQIEGGVSMGIGFLMGEEMLFDKPNGFPVIWNWENYAMPTTLEHPPYADFRPILVEPIDAIGPYGAKGIGEPPTSPPAAAIANAIYNAVGVRIHEAPVTREKILAALAAKP